MRTSTENSGKSVAAVAVVAAIGVAAIASSIVGALGEEKAATPSVDARPVAQGYPGRARPGLATIDRAFPDRVSKADYLIDLRTGVMRPLPEAVIRSVAKPDKRGLPRYAASPDGSLLAYVGTDDEGSPQIFIGGIDGSGVRQMTRDPIGARSPAWSPDGTTIAYVASGRLFVLDVARGESSPIASAGRVGTWAQPQFTPDGSSLLYSGGAPQHPPVLRTVPLDGGRSTVLIGPNEGLEVGNGSLSPDGSLVTMMGNEIGGPGAMRFVAKSDGTQLRSFPLGGSNPAGTWSPDGSRFVCSDYGGKHIIVVDVATGAASRVAKGHGAIWLDRHTLLVEALRPSRPPTPVGIGTESPPAARHAVTEEGVTFSFRVPRVGWERFRSVSSAKSVGGPISINKSIEGPQGAEAIIYWTSFPDGDHADPCARLLSPAIGPSAADLAAAVSTARGTELIAGPSPVTLGGRPAKHVVLTVRENIGCNPGFFYSWRDRYVGALWPVTRVGDTISLWIVDVDGMRLFIAAETTEQADYELKKEIRQIVKSIRFD